MQETRFQALMKTRLFRRLAPAGRSILLAAALASSLTLASAGAAQAAEGKNALPAWLPGVNLAAGASNSKAHTIFVNYVYPERKHIDYYTSKGLRVFRIGFLAARLIPSIDDKTGKSRDAGIIDDLIAYARQKNAFVILDLHEYGANGKGLIGRDPGSVEEFADTWRKIARRYRNAPNVIFGLMNEPNKQTASEWLTGANAAIAAIRGEGAKQLILVPGSYWDGAYTWTSTDNGKVMLGVVDPADNYAYELHQYFDSNSSGTSPDVVPGSGASRLDVFTQWARANKKKGFLAEFGWGRTPEAAKEGEAALAHMKDNRDVWLGWTYWAGGPWWGEYAFTVEPKDGVDRPQMKLLEQYARP